MKDRSERLSNYEALRLLCMLLILNLHSFSGWQHGSGFWQAADFFRESMSICAVDCFMLISGYFGIRWKKESFFNLVFQIFFYSIGIYVVAVAAGIVAWDTKAFLLRFACLSYDSWGFVVSYILVYFCSPLLNLFAEKQTPRSLFLYIILFLFVLNFVSFTASSAFTYAVVYLIGRFLKKINISELSFPAGRLYWISTVLIFALVYCILFKFFHITSPEIVQKRPLGTIGYDYASPLVVLQAVSLFVLFAKMTFRSTFINWCASSSFAIFLIHMHPTIKQIGYISFTEGLYGHPVIIHALYLVLFISFVFIGSILIDRVRIIISNYCYSALLTISKYIPHRIYRIDTYLPKILVEVLK